MSKLSDAQKNFDLRVQTMMCVVKYCESRLKSKKGVGEAFYRDMVANAEYIHKLSGQAMSDAERLVILHEGE